MVEGAAPQQATILVAIPCPLFTTVQAEEAIAAHLRDSLSRLDYVDHIQTVATKGHVDAYLQVHHDGDVDALRAALDKKLRRTRLPDAAQPPVVTVAEPGWAAPEITPTRPVRVRLLVDELRSRGLNQTAVVAAIRTISVPRDGEDEIRLDTVRSQLIMVEGEEIRVGDIATAEISPNVSHIIETWPAGDEEK